MPWRLYVFHNHLLFRYYVITTCRYYDISFQPYNLKTLKPQNLKLTLWQP